MVKWLAVAAVAAVSTAAQAGVVYRNVIGQGDVVEFMDTPAVWCPMQGAQQVVWTVNAGPRKGEVVQGCYVVRGEILHMIFEDGDQFALPVSKIVEMHQRQGT